MNNLKQRHGCITLWLWGAILMNLVTLFTNLSLMFNTYSSEQSLGYGILGIVCIVNLLGIVLLMRWNKQGFYIFLFSCTLGILVNIGLLKMSAGSIFLTLFSILLWWAVLQIRKNGISAWKQMDHGWDYTHCRHLYQVFGGFILLILILIFIAILGNHKSQEIEENEFNQEKELIGSFESESDNDTILLEKPKDPYEIKKTNQLKSDSDNSLIEGVVWKIFKDSTSAVVVEAPSDFRRMHLNDDQLMSLGCSDFDPFIAIVRESVSVLNSLSISTPQEYSRLFLKMIKNSGGKNLTILKEDIYGQNSYIIEYNMTVQDNEFYYKVLITKSSKYFYYCQTLCLNQYRNKLQKQMDHIIESFQILKK